MTQPSPLGGSTWARLRTRSEHIYIDIRPRFYINIQLIYNNNNQIILK